MYTLKVETKEATYLFEASNVQYQRVDLKGLNEKTKHGVFGPDPDTLDENDMYVLQVSYYNQNDVQKKFYLTEGRFFILQNGKTVDMVVIRWTD